MSQSVRQAARRQALEAQARRRQERAGAERRRSSLGVEVVIALSERDAAVDRYERVAGEALAKLTRDEHLTITEACEWASDLGVADAKRLRRLVQKASADGPDRDGVVGAGVVRESPRGSRNGTLE